jgi:hypothetical protein
MRSRRAIIIGVTAWVVVLFVAGGVWRAFNPAKPPAGTPEARFVDSRQKGYYLCLHLPATAPARHDADARKRLLARSLPRADQAAALRGCYLALRG